MVLKTQGCNSLKDNIITVFGVNIFNCLQPLDIPISDDCKVEGFVSKSGQGSGRNLGDRQFFFVNGRPSDMPKVSKLLNELYRSSNSKQYPIAIMDFTIPTRACDINVTPDKRKIFFSDENSILQALREGLLQIYSSTNVCFSLNKVDDCKNESPSADKSSPLTKISAPDISPEETTMVDDCADDIQEVKGQNQTLPLLEAFKLHRDQKLTKKDFTLRVHVEKTDEDLKTHSDRVMIDQNAAVPSNSDRSPLAGREMANSSRSLQSSLMKFVTLSKRKHESISSALTEMPVLRNHNIHSKSEGSKLGMHDKAWEIPVNPRQVGVSDELIESVPAKNLKTGRISDEAGVRGSNKDIDHPEVCDDIIAFVNLNFFYYFQLGK